MSAFGEFGEAEIREVYLSAGGDADELDAVVAAKVRATVGELLADLIANREVERLVAPLRTDLIRSVADLPLAEMRAQLDAEVGLFLLQNEDDER